MNLFKAAAFLIAALVAFKYFSGSSTVATVASDGAYGYPGYEMRALETFELKGRVLSRKDYSSGREADLSKLDLAMGWGAMADLAVVENIDISQRNRWYFWKAEQLPIPRREIETHSANIHIIAANQGVEQKLKRISAHDQIKLRGELVEVVAEDGWRWRSSLSRTDTGNGSCEVLLLHELQWI